MVGGNRSPKSGGREKEVEADHQSAQTGYGNEHQVEDEEAMQEDNTHSTDVASAQSEEPERCAVGGTDGRNEAKAPCVDGETGRRRLNGLRRGDIRRCKRNDALPTPTSTTTRRHE